MRQRYFGKHFLPQYFSVLLAVFVFVIEIIVSSNVEAVSSLDKVVSKQQGATVNVRLKNVDLKAYAKYNAEIRKAVGLSNMMLGKADPGTTIEISTSPAEKARVFQSAVEFSVSKIAKDFPDVRGTEKKVKNQGNAVSVSYVIPKDAEMVSAYAMLTYEDFTDANGKFWSVNGCDRNYYIFTSDEAFKKAYKMVTGKTLTGPVSTPAPKKKQEKNKTDSNKQNNVKQDQAKTQAKNSGDESGGIGTVGKVGIGIGTIGAIVFGISQLSGGGGGGSGAAEEAGTNEVPEETSIIFTDPATGAQTLYNKDPNTGEWYNPETGGIVNINDLDRFRAQRKADVKWTRDQMEKLSNRNTDVDRSWRQQDAEMDAEMKKTFEAIDRQGAKDKAAIRSGTYGMTDDQRAKFLKDRQDDFVSKQQDAYRTAENWDRVVQVAEDVQLAADIGVDVLSTVTAPVGGKAIGDAYAVAKNVAGSASEAAANGRSVWGGIGQGVVNGLIDVGQNHAGTKFEKALANVGGEAFKGGLDAGIKGENIVNGTCSGIGNGLTKLSIDLAGDAIGNGIEKATDNSLKNSFNHAREIRTVYSKGVSDKSVKALQKMNIQKHLSNMQKANYQSMANTITNAVVKNTVPD